MVLLIALVLLVGLFLYSSVGTVCFVAAAVVLIFGLKNGLNTANDKSGSRTVLIRTVLVTAILVGLGIFLHDLSFAALVFP